MDIPAVPLRWLAHRYCRSGCSSGYSGSVKATCPRPLRGEHRGRTFYIVQHHSIRELCERRARRERGRECLCPGIADLVPGQAANARLKLRAHGSRVVSIVGRMSYIAQDHCIREFCERPARRERLRKCLCPGSADLVRAQAANALLLKPRLQLNGEHRGRMSYMAQHHRLLELCERRTPLERLSKCLCPGIADLVPVQAADAVLKPRAHGSCVVSIVGRTLYIAQHHRLRELCERRA